MFNPLKLLWFAPLIAGIIKIIYVWAFFGVNLTTMGLVFIEMYVIVSLSFWIGFTILEKIERRNNKKRWKKER